MSILKAVNGNNNSRKYMHNKIEYLCDSTKTDGGKLIDTIGCSQRHILRDMMSVKKAYHKPHGKQGEHFVLSITPDLKSNSDEIYCKIGREIAAFFADYQALITVHKDTNTRHAHILLNSVSYKNGKKFSQGPKELNDLKLKCNRVLERYGFDLIKTSSNDIRDSNKYEDRDDFDFLEIFDDIPEKRISPIADASNDPMFADNTKSLTKGDIFMSNKNCESNLQNVAAKPSVAYNPYEQDYNYNANQMMYPQGYIPYSGQGIYNRTPVPTPPVPIYGYNQAYPNNTESYPHTINSGFAQPNPAPISSGNSYAASYAQTQEVPQKIEPYTELRLDYGQRINIYLDDFKELGDMMKHINSVQEASYEEKVENTQIAMAAFTKLQNSGYKANLVLSTNNQFNIYSKSTQPKIEIADMYL